MYEGFSTLHDVLELLSAFWNVYVLTEFYCFSYCSCYHSLRFECRTEFNIILYAVNCLHGLWRSQVMLSFVIRLNTRCNHITLFTSASFLRPTLGSTMNKCRALAGAHFVFGIIYSAGVLGLDSDAAGPLVLVVILPLALTMTAFYVWTLQSLTNTIQTLEIRKQTVKALMYRRLYRLLVFSVAILGVFFIVNTLNYVHHDDFEWPARYWHYKWFLLDGWLNILYLVVFLVIIILWRPTKNNKRYPFTNIIKAMIT